MTSKARLKKLVARLWGGRLRYSDEFGIWDASRKSNTDKVRGNSLTVLSGKLVTWNLNTLSGKRPIVKHFLEKENVAVLGLQETRRNMLQYPLRIRGYTVVEQIAPERVGYSERGMAMIVKADLAASQVGKVHPNFMFVRIPQPEGTKDWIIGNVYLPMGQDRMQIVAALRAALQDVQTKFLHHKVILMGDFNGPQDKVLWHLRSHGLYAVKFNGNAKTRHGNSTKRKWSSIDYFLGNDLALHATGSCKTLRQWDDSDHWPVQLKISLNSSDLDKESMSGGRLRLPKDKEEAFCSDKAWATLYKQRAHGKVKDVALGDKFTRITKIVAESYSDKTQAGNTFGKAQVGVLTRKEKTAIQRKQNAFQDWQLHANDSEEMAEVKLALWRTRQKEFKEIHREAGKARWNKFIQQGAEGITQHDMNKTWNFANCITGKKSQRVQPKGLLDSHGTMHYDIQGIKEAWREHYSKLGDDASIKQLDAAYWRRLLRNKKKRSILNLNEKITMDELMTTLKKLKSKKAPGLSGIPVEVYKAASDHPTSYFAKVLLDFCNTIFDKGPSPSMSESVIVNIFKDGDVSDPSNYRGISLMDTALKVVCTILAIRLNRELERKHRLIREQGGFRTLEECVAQAAGLTEILERRKAAKQDTWLAFVDFKKAFDLVPHEGLFAKCWKIGVRGSALGFIKKLYAASSARVRVGDSNSDLFPVRRGVRQGCPLSPILFLIFINDIYDKGHRGVSIPSSYGQLLKSCPGLLFADDEVTIAETPADLNMALRALDKWAIRNGMSFGIQKCGIMAVRSCAPATEIVPEFTLNGQLVPNVSEYKYLGIVISADLTMTRHVERRMEKAVAVSNALRPVFMDWSIPIAIRKMFVVSITIPTLTYGLEVGSIPSSLMCKIEACLIKPLKLIIRCKERDCTTSADALLKEFDLKKLQDIVHVRRVRLLLKYSQLDTTWLSLMTRNGNASNSRKSWVRRTKDIMSKFPITVDDGTKFTRSVTKRVLVALETDRASKKRKLTVSEEHLHRFALKPSWNRPSLNMATNFGLSVLVKMRVNAFWTTIRKAQRKLIDARWLTTCPVCLDITPETLHHLLVECSAWEKERLSSGLQDLIEKMRPMVTDTGNTDHVASIMVGNGNQITNEDWGVQLLGGQLLGVMADRYYPAGGVEGIFEPTCTFLGLIYAARNRRLWGEMHKSTITHQ